MGAVRTDNINVRTAMIYLTERCPLSCRYCYFKDKRGRDLSRPDIDAFLAFLERECLCPSAFILSGGEPLLRWKELCRLICRIRMQFPHSSIGLQTNGLLLTRDKVSFLKKTGVHVEFGIDGDKRTTVRWRRPMGSALFEKLAGNIRLAVSMGLSVGCTMTVVPDEVLLMKENLFFLKWLGFSSVDVTPAAFMSWGRKEIAEFKKVYKNILGIQEISSLLLKEEDRDLLKKGQIDLSLHPPGVVLAGDPFLCLPERVRHKFSLWGKQKKSWCEDILRFYWKGYEPLWDVRKKLKTYRHYVCRSFELVNQMMGREYLNVAQIVPLMDFLTKQHQ